MADSFQGNFHAFRSLQRVSRVMGTRCFVVTLADGKAPDVYKSFPCQRPTVGENNAARGKKVTCNVASKTQDNATARL